MALISYLMRGFTLGLTAGAQPGPFQAYLISQTTSRGWRATLVAAFAPLISDGPIVALVLLVLSQVPGWFERFLQIGGGLFLLYLAWTTFRAWKAFAPETDTSSLSGTRSLLRASLMNLLSPGPYLFWSLVLGPFVLEAWHLGPHLAVTFIVSFYAALILLNAAIIILFGLASRFGDKLRRGLLGASAIALGLFGIYQLFNGLT
jgi:threonine/homoserine/homoserine lactone efflux protein